MTDDRDNSSLYDSALLVRLDERVQILRMALDRHDERINEFADAMMQTAMSLRDVVAMQRIMDERMNAIEADKRERQDRDGRITQQKFVLIGTMFASIVALMTSVITAWIQVVS